MNRYRSNIAKRSCDQIALCENDFVRLEEETEYFLQETKQKNNTTTILESKPNRQLNSFPGQDFLELHPARQDLSRIMA